MFYTVGEVAKQMDVPASTLRFYDKEGLLPFVERSGGGIRMFKESDMEFLKIISCLKKAGLRVKDIRLFIQMVMEGDETIPERLALFERQRREVKRQIEELEETLQTLNYKCWYYETAQRMGSTKAVDEIAPEQIPKELRAAKKRLKNGSAAEEGGVM